MNGMESLLPALIVVCVIVCTAGGLAVMVYGLAMLFDALTNERRRADARARQLTGSAHRTDSTGMQDR